MLKKSIGGEIETMEEEALWWIFLLKLVDSVKLDSKKEKKSNQWFLYLPSPLAPLRIQEVLYGNPLTYVTHSSIGLSLGQRDYSPYPPELTYPTLWVPSHPHGLWVVIGQSISRWRTWMRWTGVFWRFLYVLCCENKDFHQLLR